MNQVAIEQRVIGVVAKVASELDYPPDRIGPMTSLIDDIGLDSLRVINLTVALEDELGLREFPVQAWADRERDRGHTPRFSVESLALECTRLMQSQGAM